MLLIVVGAAAEKLCQTVSSVGGLVRLVEEGT
jgi:hypothetical protein